MTEPAESQRVEDIATQSQCGVGVNRGTVLYSFKVFKRFMRHGLILEMGAAERFMSDTLAHFGQPLQVIEASSRFCEELRGRYPSPKIVHGLFEDFTPAERFANIILGHVLKHVQDPSALLTRAGPWLADEGRLFAAIPNSRSLHRQAAVFMGLLPFEEALNDADRNHGHRRVYNPETFRREILQAGLDIQIFGG